ncbi:uncharacterized protein LOC124113205 isoform X2 [Haliotis rufescens]|uniref:uncharacterized protein LOC124113205 isoform X2 n=1 Tax=Haliotis rufescens TaxID=6454 RepID=UPI00201EE1CE|nr:uncharacterized protein LOC124113205 isoform X2 [Haliotis rufescens]
MIGRVLLFCLCILACHIDLSHQQVFLLELQNATAAVGSTTYFQAAVLGTITGQGNWSRNGVPIVHQPGKYNILTAGIFRQLFITNTALSDAGTISFRINGEASSAQLTVLQGAVSIVSGPTAQTVNTGSTVTLQATLSQSNIQTGQWYKNGAVLTTNARIQTFVNGQSQILRISNVQTSDGATYEYRVNGLSTSALLTVNVPIGAVSIVSGPTAQTVNTGSTVILQATLSQSNIQTGQWYKNGAVLTTNARIQTFVNGQSQILRISNVQTSDGATYEYRVNGLSTSALLTVNVPIGAVSIVSGPTAQTVNTGSTVILQATLSQSNIQTGQWYKNGAVLTTNARIQTFVNGQSQILSISNVQTSDGATYEYRVNGLSTSALLTVNVPIGAVSIVSGPTAQTVNTGNTVILQATLSQSNIQTGQWYKNGAVLTTNARIQTFVNGQSQILSISNVQTSDGATYEYRVNGLSTSALLSVNVPIVNGGFSQWTDWTGLPCGVACETRTDVIRTRTRSCSNPAPSSGGRNCTGSFVDVLSACVGPVNGGFSLWSEWTDPSCGITCGSTNGVIRSRTRSCTNPVPSNGGLPCFGDVVQTSVKTCSFAACQVNGGLTAWTQWTDPPCGITCGQRSDVMRTRTRSCSNPLPSNGGRDCTGSLVEVLQKTCFFPACVVNGGLTPWSQWSGPPCDLTCGAKNDVVRTRTRSCTNPAPSNGGLNCTGPFVEVKASCVVPVNGGFTQWTQWTNPFCGITCGSTSSVLRSRTRSCTNPIPTNGGLQCSGDSVETFVKTCVFPGCPVNGGLTLWTQWTNPPCGISCGTRTDLTRTRTRSCTIPPPSNGGQGCTGLLVEVEPRNCDFAACTVNGGFTLWTQWTNPPCGITCGRRTEIRTRTRSCTNPAPSNGGTPCSGPIIDILPKSCDFTPCVVAVNGGFTQWTQWTTLSCGITCGSTNSLVRSRTRSCTNPFASNGGQQCIGNTIETLSQPCVFSACQAPVNGGLTQWTTWTNPGCGITCGVGASVSRTRVRTCTNPAPANGGQVCNGPFVQVLAQTCSFSPCAVNGGFTQWSQWTSPTCGISCGSTNSVVRSRFRSCTNPVASNGGQSCTGDRVQTLIQTCVFSPCPVNGGLTQWTLWTEPPCGIICGTRTDVLRTRSRSCSNPAASNGGLACNGPFVETAQKACAFSPCVVNGGLTQWTQWTNPACGITCGSTNSLVRSRTRSCTNPVASNGGQQCFGNTLETSSTRCVFRACPVDGGLTLWTEWTNPPCSSACVIRTRTRTCTNPPSSNGGLNCTGALLGVVKKTCDNVPCIVPVNGSFTQWTEWTGPPCSVTCGAGPSVVRRRSRSCTNPPPSNGGNGCFGDVLQTISTPCSFPECGGLCTSVTYRDGIGYRYHPTDCDKYIQCYNNPSGNVVAMYRRCPFGKFWNQVTFQCDESWRVVCPHDKCKDNSTATFNLLGSCRAYWECDTNFVAVPKCCSVGYSYVHREGCKPNLFCRDLCPTACEDRDLCDKRPDWSANPATYNMSVGILGWVPTSCAAGTQFDITNCGCSALNQSCSASNAVTFTAGSSLTSALASWLELSNVEVSNGIANFNGSSRLVATVTMPTASTANPLIIRFRYRESGAVFGRRVLVSTSDCKNGSSLVIAVDSYTMTFELTSWYNWAVTLPVSMAGFSRDDWKTVTFSYAGYDMLAVVESATLKYAAKVHAPQSTIMQCALTFGTDSKNDATNNFIGQLDQLSLYQCDPGNLY